MDRQKPFERTDKELISLFLEDEVNFWALKWGVSNEMIKAAVKASGSNSVTKVYTYLESTNKIRFS